jgi:hypothetical protein
MGNAFGLTVGINHVDSNEYAGWDGALNAAVNDSNDMLAILKSQGFATRQLLNSEATADVFLQSIEETAAVMKSGDIFCLCFSGHGGQMSDQTGWGWGSTVDTLCLYSRQVIGHELLMRWQLFPPGSRVLMFSDSCHSGTVSRDSPDPTLNKADPELNKRTEPAPLEDPDFAMAVPKGVPMDIQMMIAQHNHQEYEQVFKGLSAPIPPVPVVLFAACASNQTASDGTRNGLFTDRFRRVWQDGRFAGDYTALQRGIISQMPSYQSATLFLMGPVDPAFMASRPFSH